MKECAAWRNHCLNRGVGAVCVTLDRTWAASLLPGTAPAGSPKSSSTRIKVEHVVDTGPGPATLRPGDCLRLLAYRNYVVAASTECMGPQRCTRTETERLPLTRENGAAGSARRTALDCRRNFPEHPGGTDSGWLIVQVGSAAAPGPYPSGHMQNQWDGYTFGAAGPPSVTAKAGQAAGGCRGRFLASPSDGFDPGDRGSARGADLHGQRYLCTTWRGGVGRRRRPCTIRHVCARRLQPRDDDPGPPPVLNEDLVNLTNWLVLRAAYRRRGMRSGWPMSRLLGYPHEYDIRT